MKHLEYLDILYSRRVGTFGNAVVYQDENIPENKIYFLNSNFRFIATDPVLKLKFHKGKK